MLDMRHVASVPQLYSNSDILAENLDNPWPASFIIQTNLGVGFGLPSS